MIPPTPTELRAAQTESTDRLISRHTQRLDKGELPMDKNIECLGVGAVTTKYNNNQQGVLKPLFSAILIANRGEIAVRITSTLKKLGIKSIAVYSQEDSQSKHVKEADSSFLLPGDTLTSTYLSIDTIINTAKISGAEAIIPGYGFLSESAEFAAACEDNGLTWIGPTPQQMKQLGLKHLARELADKVGLPLHAGTGLIGDINTAIAQAEEIGYPVMIKSSAGGGGIGIQRCADPEALRDAFESILHLSKSICKDDGIFIEKFVENTRHVEVQIIGNGHGLVKHAGERDCSLQRRNQKLLEEGPAVFLPERVRSKMHQAAISLAASVSYRGIGTVEFLYSPDDQSFLFLEVNTRIQVEHTVTEVITGLDLVESMIRIAANDWSDLFLDGSVGFAATKVAIQARIYGESPLQNFRPSAGQLLHVSFPEDVRVDTWVSSGSVLSLSYDPLLAKIIAAGHDRAEAIQRLSSALDRVKLSGIETNLEYLKQIVLSTEFKKGTHTTKSLDSFKFQTPAFEVLEPGPSTTVQDFPGRQGLWHAGVPPSGPMDDYAFRVANKILGNDLGAASLECTHAGPKLLFHHDANIAVTGGTALLLIDDVAAPLFCANFVKAGQILQLGVLKSGCRAYLAIQGGIKVPEVFGSQSTFALGNIGGHCGRQLIVGDMITFCESSSTAERSVGSLLPSNIPVYVNSWMVKVMPGPHAFPDIFLESSFKDFFTCPWKVHYNSNRVGVRLTGPKPQWARKTGGVAGLHPSNIHDSPYSIGSISFTGDEAVILTCDGPSLGGFVVFATIVAAEMWKVGQMKPDDEVFFSPISAYEAMSLDVNLCDSINNLSPVKEIKFNPEIYNPILGDIGSNGAKILCRQAGDCALLLEFGDADFDIRSAFRIYGLMDAHRKVPIHGVIELTPGARSLHVLYNASFHQAAIVSALQSAALTLPSDTFTSGIPSRTFNLPLAFEHPTSLAAVERYSNTIRSRAPWLPSNVDFLRRINGLEVKEDVNNVLLSATYLVVGLGDVFFGSPCAIPLDPRHRLFGMKYNPSRSFTPEGTVGVGGQYLCIYGIDSPGGYQLVGRTVPIWNRWAKEGHPWMFNVFDQIRFYPVSEQVIDNARTSGEVNKLVTVVDGKFDLVAYESWLQVHDVDILAVTNKRWQTLNDSDAVAQALEPPPPPPVIVDRNNRESFKCSENGLVLKSEVAGKCWKSATYVGETLKKGQTLFWIEAMKMEIKVISPADAVCTAVFVKAGDLLTADCLLAELSPL